VDLAGSVGLDKGDFVLQVIGIEVVGTVHHDHLASLGSVFQDREERIVQCPLATDGWDDD
jgi:hypothetical protein